MMAYQFKVSESQAWKWMKAPKYFHCNIIGGNAAPDCLGNLDKDPLSYTLIYPEMGEGGITGTVLCSKCAIFNGAPAPDSESPIMPTKKLKICLGCEIEICNVCAVCHTEDCPFVERKVVTLTEKAKFTHLYAKTQKARGYVTLAESGLNVPKPYRIIISEGDIDETISAMAGKSGFIRPCPMRPRHGFVDSRPITVSVESKQEIADLLKTAIAADDEGHAELLLVPYIDSAYNAIVTPNRIAVGPGHDGATGGQQSKSFPLAGVPFKEITPAVLRLSKISDNEDPYIEAVVQENRKVYFTQIRAGVKIAPTVGADFIPYPVRVTEVIEASGDLLEWEAQTKQIKRGTVVCHIGGTLISHYGVHCMQNDIPVFTSRRPNIGEVLEVVNKVQKPDPQAVLKGLGVGAAIPLGIDSNSLTKEKLSVSNGLVAMMTILHNSAAMSGEDGFWIGFAVSMMYRAGMAASHGEARHKLNGAGGSREGIYKLALKNFFDGRNTLGHAQWKFKHQSWSSGYGGAAWAKCTDSIIDMDNTIRKLYIEPTEHHVAELVGNLNVAVNQAHNGGWWLNKFIGQSYFTEAAAQSLNSVVTAGAVMFKAQEIMKDSAVDAKLLMDDWGISPEIKVENGKLQIQIAHLSIDEVDKPTKIKGKNTGIWSELCAPYGTSKFPEDSDYVGVYCKICGKMFNDLDKGDLEAGMVCGAKVEGSYSPNCIGLIGWYENGLFAYPIDSGDSSEDDDDNTGEAHYDPPSSFDDEDDSTPGMIKHISGGKSYSNLNGTLVPTDAKVVSAQGNFHKAYKWLHVQYKIEGLNGYKSCDVSPIHLKPELIEKAVALLTLPSYSGSGKAYAEMKFEPWVVIENPAAWKLSIPELKLLVGLDTKYNTLLELEWEEQPDEPTQAKKIEGDSNESPF